MRQTTREELFHLLAEASELEHNLLCSYLFALFSLKRRQDEGLTTAEHAAVQRWRNTLLSVCVEEMVHLAQVANLTAALGGRPHFNRPNLPVSPGYHPAKIVVELTPFNAETLKHFVFLERPEAIELEDPGRFSDTDEVERPPSSRQSLIPSAPDYSTVGEFYAAVRKAVISFCHGRSEQSAFLGTSFQLDGSQLNTPSLRRVVGLQDALEAIDAIVEQGEGASVNADDSHFARFEAMLRELESLQAARAGFVPARNMAANPVMRPPQAAARQHVTAASARACLDGFNAVYWMMLRTLAALYELDPLDEEASRALVAHMLGCMHLMGDAADALTQLPASDADASVMAGPSFTMFRHAEGFAGRAQAIPLLRERSVEVAQRFEDLAERGLVTENAAKNARRLAATLEDIRRP